MPHGKNKFNEKWLSQKDESGSMIREWCKSVYNAYCSLCCKTFQDSNFKQVLAHSSGKSTAFVLQFDETGTVHNEQKNMTYC